MSWHVGHETLEAYLDGTIDNAAAWSVEAHVTSCGDCRARVASPPRLADAGSRLDAIWTEVEDTLDLPRPSVVERAITALGVPTHLARLLAATRSLTTSWLAAVVGILAVVTVGAHLAWDPRALFDDNVGVVLPFLVVVPLLPLAGVAAAFGPNVDPTYEIGLAAPLRSVRLLLIRSVAVLATTLPLALLAAILLPSVGLVAVAWVVPALALTTIMLALSTWLPPLVATGGVTFAWVAAVALAEVGGRVPLVAFREHGQLWLLALGAAATTWIVTRRDRFELEGGR